MPYSKGAEPITRLLERNGINIAYAAGRKVRDLVTVSRRGSGEGGKESESVVYNIPCGGCQASYFGETCRGIKRRVYEHKYDIKQHKTSNSLVVHVDSHGHLPNWKGARVLHSNLSRATRKLVEAAYISTSDAATNHKGGSMCLSKPAARLTLSDFDQSQAISLDRPAG